MQPGIAKGTGIIGVWQGISLSVGPSTQGERLGVRYKVFSPIFFSNGQAYFGPKFPTEGLEGFDSRVPAELYRRDWGTYTFSNGKGVLRIDCYQIKDPEELADYLKVQGRDAFHDWDYQLQTNYGFVHELKNGQVAFFDNHFNQKAILFETKKCFDDIIKADKFPVDNPDKEMFEIEGDRMKVFICKRPLQTTPKQCFKV